jgi:hypothetical protein
MELDDILWVIPLLLAIIGLAALLPLLELADRALHRLGERADDHPTPPAGWPFLTLPRPDPGPRTAGHATRSEGRPRVTRGGDPTPRR